MVTPLGPDFSAALGIPTSRLGLVTGSYAAAASVAGMLGTLFLDRFDRRSALGVSLAGLVIGTVAGALTAFTRCFSPASWPGFLADQRRRWPSRS